MTDAPVLLRSSLTVPLNNPRFIEKAHLRGADAIMLDLEDGVAPSAKSEARARLPDAVAQVRRGGARIRVRLNQSLDLLVRDIEAAVVEGVDELAVAKAESRGQIEMISGLIGSLESQRGLPVGRIQLHAAIETSLGLTRVNEIATADPRLCSIGLGSLDLAAECGFAPTEEALFGPKQMLLFAAKAAGIRSWGYLGSIDNFGDLDAMRAMLRRSRRLGFTGGGAIHPNQVPILNEEFSPSAEEVVLAERLVEEAEKQFAAGRGAFAHNGRMVDKPVVDAAKQLLRTAEAVAAHDARMARLRADAGV